MGWKYYLTFVVATNILAFTTFMFMKRLEKKEYYFFGLWLSTFIIMMTLFIRWIWMR